MALNLPWMGEDGNTYYIACDAAGGSAANNAGGGLVQINGEMARYAYVLQNGDGTGPTTWKPDGSDQAVRAVSLVNCTGQTLDITITLYDATGNGTTRQFWSGQLPPNSIPVKLNFPLTNGLTWALSAAIPVGSAGIAILAN